MSQASRLMPPLAGGSSHEAAGRKLAVPALPRPDACSAQTATAAAASCCLHGNNCWSLLVLHTPSQLGGAPTCCRSCSHQAEGTFPWKVACCSAVPSAGVVQYLLRGTAAAVLLPAGAAGELLLVLLGFEHCCIAGDASLPVATSRCGVALHGHSGVLGAAKHRAWAASSWALNVLQAAVRPLGPSSWAPITRPLRRRGCKHDSTWLLWALPYTPARTPQQSCLPRQVCLPAASPSLRYAKHDLFLYLMHVGSWTRKGLL